MSGGASGPRIPILYLAPWVDYGGTDKGTIDWFRWIDRDRFAPMLATTQPSANRRLAEVVPYAEEVWALPDLMPGEHMPSAIFDLISSRGVRVLHVMNSRLGYDLLPDLSCLRDPPKVVVQLHVEESDRSGYVRYVTTRYGNLVDCFSVTSEHLAQAVQDYGVPRDRIRVIHTGVDAEEEFAPERASPVEGLAGDRVHILFPGRLVEQKDPLLMVEVAAALRDRGLRFQIHAVGEGDLEPRVRERLAGLGLGDHVLIHPPTRELQRWYAACDLLLMTSVFEGVPYVVFEAMAMGLPVVAPALPGNRELLGDGAALVEPRDSVPAYAEALARLIEDAGEREERAREGRERVRERFSLRRMADDHGDLYTRLLPEGTPPPPEEPREETPIRFRDRPLFGTPLVSVVIPHFNQGRVLVECLEAIRAQTYPAIETVVVDDASSEADTAEVLDELESQEDVRVIRLEENRGPSRARNRGFELCRGRYILPVDADNLLLPDAVERLVEQLSEASEDVGFIYPNLQYFGNREDYFEAPPYNVYELTRYNFCDTCSLLDRGIIDAGETFREEIHLGHEDWEFVLRLAARGVRGEAARGPTLRYRKWGFNRSDAVEYMADPFHEVVGEISPFRGYEENIKSREAPALSLMLLEPLDAAGEVGRRVTGRLADQSCLDMELIARFDGAWPAAGDFPRVHRMPPGLAETPGEALQQARAVARGSFLAATRETGSALLDDRAFVEKVFRCFRSRPALDAIALTDAGAGGGHPFEPVTGQDGDLQPHTLIWRRAVEDRLPGGLLASARDPVPSMTRLLTGSGAVVEWRHLAARGGRERPELGGEWIPVDGGVLSAAIGTAEDRAEFPNEPLLPGPGLSVVPRWLTVPTWTPPQSVLLCRHREIGGLRRIVTNDRRSPEGFEIEWDLGMLRISSFEGTVHLLRIGDDYAALPRGEWHSAPADAEELGYVELAPFPLLDPLVLALHRPSGTRVLVTLPDDPLVEEVDVIRGIGYIERFPIRPRLGPVAERPYGAVGLIKAVDYRSRRHRYAVGEVPEGELVGELGALADSPLPGAKPVWITDGRLITESHRPPAGRPPLEAVVRWSGAPARWRGFSEPAPKARAIVRRAVASAARLAVPAGGPPEPNGAAPVAWMYEEPRLGRVPLHVGYHPVTGDQLLTHSPDEARNLGYVNCELLGFVQPVAPVTGSLEQRVLPLPWASRFGLAGRG